MNDPDFWEKENSNEILTTVSFLKKELSDYEKINLNIKELKSLVELNDFSLEAEINKEIELVSTDLEELENKTLLSGPYDNLNCYLEIHPGAGGTESCDWADMLKRMYIRFCERNNYKYEIVNEQKGEEAGLKSLTMIIKGEFAYGYFKSEKGVHRLVRISPFDSNKRRHTSFASVSITPEFNKIENVTIDEKDLKIDVYHSSGAGGQSVNTSDSAVRITHLPSKIVVACQTERSQLKNKEKAMNMLKNKLFELELEKQNKSLKEIKGHEDSINFGSQIRNYVLEPYTLVKDSRTNYETSNAAKVLDGDIIEFMLEYLKR